jgi:hypothetical protein
LLDFQSDPRFGHKVEAASAAPWLQLSDRPTLKAFMSVEQLDGAFLLIDSSPGGMFNRVFALGLDKPASEATLDGILEIYKAHQSKNLLVHLSPTARPTTLPRLLEDRGMKAVGREAVVVREAKPIKRPDPYFRIREAGPEDADDVNAIMEGIGGLPKSLIELVTSSRGLKEWRHYIAHEGTKAYSVGGIFINGEIAWMAPGWTLPEYRNRGAHSALIAQCINEAAAAGCQWITTTYPASLEERTRTYDRLGFHLLYMRNLFLWRADAAQ